MASSEPYVNLSQAVNYFMRNVGRMPGVPHDVAFEVCSQCADAGVSVVPEGPLSGGTYTLVRTG